MPNFVFEYFFLSESSSYLYSPTPHFCYFVHFRGTIIYDIQLAIALLNCLCLRNYYQSFTDLLTFLVCFFTLCVFIL